MTHNFIGFNKNPKLRHLISDVAEKLALDFKVNFISSDLSLSAALGIFMPTKALKQSMAGAMDFYKNLPLEQKEVVQEVQKLEDDVMVVLIEDKLLDKVGEGEDDLQVAKSLIFHEIIHCKQVSRGDMVIIPETDQYLWKGKSINNVPLDVNPEAYFNLPWEQEAYQRQADYLNISMAEMKKIAIGG